MGQYVYRAFRLRGGDALWFDPGPAGVILRAEVFPPAASSGSVKGSLAAQEAGSDTVAGSGRVLIAGAMATADGGSDSVSGVGRVAITGALVAQEAGADAASAVGRVRITGTLSVVEPGGDTFAGVGTVQTSVVTGFLAARETGPDMVAIFGIVTGELRRAGPRRGGSAVPADARTMPATSTRDETPQFVRPSPATARRPRPPNFRRSA